MSFSAADSRSSGERALALRLGEGVIVARFVDRAKASCCWARKLRRSLHHPGGGDDWTSGCGHEEEAAGLADAADDEESGRGNAPPSHKWK